jgi:hypothetical protein
MKISTALTALALGTASAQTLSNGQLFTVTTIYATDSCSGTINLVQAEFKGYKENFDASVNDVIPECKQLGSGFSQSTRQYFLPTSNSACEYEKFFSNVLRKDSTYSIIRTSDNIYQAYLSNVCVSNFQGQSTFARCDTNNNFLSITTYNNDNCSGKNSSPSTTGNPVCMKTTVYGNFTTEPLDDNGKPSGTKTSTGATSGATSIIPGSVAFILIIGSLLTAMF